MALATMKNSWEDEEKKEQEILKNLCFLFYLITPHTDALEIYDMWHLHTVLRDYKKPDFNKLRQWVEEFETELSVYKSTKT